MKRLIASICMFFILFTCISFADNNEKYIFINESLSNQMSENELAKKGIYEISDGIFTAPSKASIYDVSDKSDIENISLNDKGTVGAYPAKFNDKYIGNQWNIGAVNADVLWALGYRGNRKVVVAVTDTGYARDCYDVDYTNIQTGVNVTESSDDVSDVYHSEYAPCYGHGTHVINIIKSKCNNGKGIAGLADKVSILPIRVTNISSGDDIKSSDLIKGINYAREHNADVINISISFSKYNEALEKACQDAVDDGCIVVASAGNIIKLLKDEKGEYSVEYTQQNSIAYPASFDCVIGVGAVMKNGEVWGRSYIKTNAFVTAPGAGICSIGSNGNLESIDGTSFSAPHVSALAAILKSIDSDMTSKEFSDILINSSSNGGIKKDKNGYGTVNFEKAVRTLNGTKPFGKVYVNKSITYSQAKSGEIGYVYNSDNTKKITYLKSYKYIFGGGLSCGEKKITVKGINNYEDVYYFTRIIKPDKAVLSSVKNGKKKFTANISTRYSTGVDGYQIKYKRKGTSKWYSYSINKSKSSLTVNNLRSGKTYYVKTRAYAYADGKKVYGEYSKTKTVKVR